MIQHAAFAAGDGFERKGASLGKLVAHVFLEAEQGREGIVQVRQDLGFGSFGPNVQNAAQNAVVNFEALTIERKRRGVIALLIVKRGQIAQIAGEIGMVGAFAFGDDRNRLV